MTRAPRKPHILVAQRPAGVISWINGYRIDLVDDRRFPDRANRLDHLRRKPRKCDR